MYLGRLSWWALVALACVTCGEPEESLRPLDQARPRWVAVKQDGGYYVVKFDEPAEPEKIWLDSDWCVWSPDGARLACSKEVSKTDTVRIHEAPTFEVVDQVSANDRAVSLSWHDANTVSWHELAGEVGRVWDLSTGEVTDRAGFLNLRVFFADESREHEGYISHASAESALTWHRLEEPDAETQLPSADQIWASPAFDQIALVNPESVPEDLPGVWSMSVPGKPLSHCPPERNCDIPLAPEVHSVRFDPQERFVIAGILQPYAGPTAGDFTLHVTPKGADITQLGSLSSVRVMSTVSDETWTLSEAGVLYAASSFATGHSVIEEFPDPISGSVEIWRGDGLVSELAANADHSVLVIVRILDWDTRTVEITALHKNASSKEPTDEDAQDASGQEASAWIEQRVATLTGLPLDLSGILSVQPGGERFLVTAPRMILPFFDSAHPAWRPEYEENTGNGYSVYELIDGKYALSQFGDGVARFAPAGDGLLVWHENELSFVPSSAAPRRYPLAEWQEYRSVLVPARWPDDG